MSDYQVLIGDCLESMKKLPDKSIYSGITSPPYYGLRDYGVSGQIGLEETPEQYISRLVYVFRELRRVIRDDGTLWVNIADSYAGSGKGAWNKADIQKEVYVPDSQGKQAKMRKTWDGIKPKDLIGIPWMLAFALRADGWYLRADIIWHKPNAMPSSVKDRCNIAHEYIFMLSKSKNYYYDHEAVMEDAVRSAKGKSTSFKRVNSKRGIKGVCPSSNTATHRSERSDVYYDSHKRTRRSVWSVATKPFKGAHFATFPAELIEPCVLAGCPEGGTVIDPFGGSGTVAGVALANGRKAIICELNPEYTELIPARISEIQNKSMRLHK